MLCSQGIELNTLNRRLVDAVDAQIKKWYDGAQIQDKFFDSLVLLGTFNRVDDPSGFNQHLIYLVVA